MENEIDAALVGKLAAMCAAENGMQRKWIYKFTFCIRWVNVSRRAWAGDDLGYKDVIAKDTRATTESLTVAIETLRRVIEKER